MFKHGFYLVQYDDKLTYTPPKITEIEPIIQAKEKEHYITYEFNCLGAYGMFEKINIWKFKQYDNLYLIFTTSRKKVKDFSQLYYSLTFKGLTYLNVDYNLQSKHLKEIWTLDDGCYQGDNIPQQIDGQMIQAKYQFHINGKEAIVELFYDGLVKVNLPLEEDIIYEVVKQLMNEIHSF